MEWALALLLVFGFAQTGFAQSASSSDPPLNFGTNYFVTGDFVVAGAYGMTTKIANGFATGTISLPDANPGITAATSVPAGAQIVAAVLYWETVEKSTTTAGNSGTGQKGFFRPVFKDGSGPQTGYILNGVLLNGQNTVSFSNGGCTGGSTGKVVRTYRADVRGYLPQDANGNVLVNSTDGVTFEVRLPSTTNTTPITLGATLVLIYRVLSSPDPLNPSFVPLSVVSIYDGGFAPGGVLLTMTQTVQGFYQAGASPVSRLAHIVGSGHSNKFQTVYLNGNQRVPPVQLPSLYGSGQPAFPGWYVLWDNPVWTFPYPKNAKNPPPPNYPPNPLQENDDSATSMVVPGMPPGSTTQQGCTSWGAVIVSTTVNDPNHDGILKKWKTDQGYTDVATGQFVSLADQNDPINTGQPRQDVFIQLDHVVDSKGDFTPDPTAVTMVKNAFLANGHDVHLHISGGNAIQEPMCKDADIAPQLCAYPNQPGITTWREGFEFVENQPLNYTTELTAQLNEADCEANTAPLGKADCVRRFAPAQRNSHHYVVFGDTLGAANWGFLGGALTDSTGTGPGVVVQQNSSVTFYTSRGHGLVPNNMSDGDGRVTITGAISDPDLNGTHFVTGVNCPISDCSVSNKALGPYAFTIDIGTPVSTPPPTVCPKGTPAGASCYTRKTDPNLSVASGQAGTGSGFSDLGGAATLVTLGSWPLAYQTVSAKDGTFMHELGHTLGLLHGGGDGINCKSNYQSVMNYMFQTKLLGPSGVLDFSSQQLSPLDETSLLGTPITTMGPMPPPIAFSTTRWYDTTPKFAFVNGILTAIGTTATQHCDGTPLSVADPATYQFKGGTVPMGMPFELVIPWSKNSLDINFDGTKPGSELPPLFTGYDDWANTDFRQVGAGGNEFFGFPGSLFVSGSPGSVFVPGGPGGGFVPSSPGGGFVPSGPGGGFVPAGPGGGFVPGGPGASVELDAATAVSVTDPPSNLTASEDVSPRNIHLSWIPATFPQMEKFNIYRSSDNGGTFAFLTSVPAPPLPAFGTPPPVMYTDPVTCKPAGYAYFVTSILLNTAVTPSREQESVPSNTAPTTPPLLTGCYTNTPPTVALNNLSSPANTTFVQGVGTVPITWSLQDDDTGVFVNSATAAPNNPLAANTLVAFGPFPNDQGCPATLPAGMPPTTLLSQGVVQSAGSTFGISGNTFTFSWDTTPFNAGCYFFQLNLLKGNGQSNGQSETTGTAPNTATALTLLIFVSDQIPHVMTTALPNGVVWNPYSNLLFEAGGLGPFQWTVVAGSGSLPPGISLDLASGTLSGTPTASGIYNFTVKVTDSVGNFGTQALMLTVDAALLVAHSVTDGTCAISQLDAANGSFVRLFGTLPGTPASPCTELRAHLALSGRLLYRSNGVSLNTISQFSPDTTLVSTIVPNTSNSPSIVPIARDFASQLIYMVDTFGGTNNIFHLDVPSTGASSLFTPNTNYMGFAGILDLYFGGPSGSQALFALTQTDPSITPCSVPGCAGRVAKIDSNGIVQFFDNPNLITPFIFDVGSLAVDPTSGNIYVATGNISANQPGTIVELSAAGNFISSFPLSDGKPSLDVDLSGNIFVGRASSNTGEISVFSASGALLKTINVPNATSIIDVLIAP